MNLIVTDALGRVVASLVDGYKPAGTHSVTFNGANFPSGVYYYRLSAGGNVLTRKMSLVK